MSNEEWEVGQWITAETTSGMTVRALVMAKHRDEQTGDITYTLCERPHEWSIIGADVVDLLKPDA